MTDATDEPRSPSFARSFPRDPALDALVAAFQAGNFAQVRRDAPALIASTADEAVKRAAETLIARTRPDPVAALLIGLAALLLFTLSAWWIAHGGGK